MTEEKKYAKDPIPAKAILLADAFDWAFEKIYASPEILTTLGEFQEILKLNRECEEGMGQYEEGSDLDRAATIFFRNHLYVGNLLAYIRDPETGDILQLDQFDWRMGHNGFWPLRLPRRVDSFATNGDAVPNPNTFLRGAYRPVFLWRDEFERWLKKTLGHQKHGGGRPTGSGSWQVADEPLVDEMDSMIKTGKAKSPNDAARLLADRASGSGTLVSKQSRLAIRYRKKFGPEKN